MRLLLACLILLASVTAAAAQGCGPQNPNCIAPTPPPGDNSNRIATTAFVQGAIGGGGGGGMIPLAAGNIYVGNNSNVATGVTLTGDCTMSVVGAITCTKTNGVALGSAATVVAGTAGNVLVSNGSALLSVAMSGSCTMAAGGVINCLTSTTPPPNYNSTRIATTAYVQANAGFPITNNTQLYINSGTGSDTGNCQNIGSPCQSFGYVANQCNIGTQCFVNVANGTYLFVNNVGAASPVNFTYYHVITFQGDCSALPASAANVLIQPSANSQIMFSIQDHALAFIKCMTVVNPSSVQCSGQCQGVTVIQSRQLAIVDADNLGIQNALPLGKMFDSTEVASLNCAGILNLQAFSMNNLATVTQFSKMSFGCNVTAAAGTINGATFAVSNGSWLDVSSAIFGGAGAGTGTSGTACAVSNGSIVRASGVTIPGNLNSCTAANGSGIF